MKDLIAEGWTASQKGRRNAVLSGATVTASNHAGADEPLIEWAKDNGLLVRVDRRSDWGNPFKVGRDGNRATVIERFEAHYRRSPDLQARIGELRGKVLLCWCHPEPCHGDFLARMAQANPAAQK